MNDSNPSSQSTPQANSQPLVLVPTELELALLKRSADFNSLIQHHCSLEICGFGPIVSAAKTSQLIARHNPPEIVLVGIAGTYKTSLAIGSAHSFDRVSCFGIGVGSGDDYQSATQSGWPQWAAANPDDQIEDSISLSNSPLGSATNETLLTCTTSSNSPDDVAKRLAEFPDAVAEDMEGFSVAVACRFAEVPLTIIRGISNRAGDRTKANWKIEEAIASAAALVVRLVRETQP